MVHGKAGAPRNNTNRLGKATKQKKRIQVNMSISDHSEMSDGVFADLRERFEGYLLCQGIQPTEEEIKAVARQWAYAAWWQNLSRAEDERVMIL